MELLNQAGLNFRKLDRTLFARVRDMPIDVIFLRADDIPVLCAEGAIDIGLTGSDLVGESEVEVTHRMDLGIGRCSLALCVPMDRPLTKVEDLQSRRVATSFPRTTARWLAEHGVSAHLVELSGSVEIMIQLGVADAIVDLVETGSTLAANRLDLFATIGHYQTVLIQNPNTAHVELIDRIVRRLEGVIIARGWSLLEYNVPRAKLRQAEQLTPGFSSPTVSALEDADWCAVRAMVKSGEVHAIMERLEELGAAAILETKINNCRL
jgi:ATP phosphoribosyltransferase